MYLILCINKNITDKGSINFTKLPKDLLPFKVSRFPEEDQYDSPDVNKD